MLREKSFVESEEGFTLIELMLVVAVLGIIAGIAVPQISGVQDEANVAALESTAATIQNAMEREKAMEGQYPDLDNNGTDLDGALQNTDLSGDFDVDSMSNTTDGYSITINPSGSATSPSLTITPGSISTN